MVHKHFLTNCCCLQVGKDGTIVAHVGPPFSVDYTDENGKAYSDDEGAHFLHFVPKFSLIYIMKLSFI